MSNPDSPSNDSSRTASESAARETIPPPASGPRETVPPSADDSVGESSPPGPLPGSDFGRYRLDECIGQGAMGVVYRALDTELDREVALKIPLGTGAQGSDFLERFRREARSAATLRHANICPVHDVGEIDGFHYLTMAFIEGRPLSDLVALDERPSLRKSVQIVRKVASGLMEAHRQGVVHRDLKPANIMLDQRGEPLVMDFGLARRDDSADGQRMTQEGSILGSPAYMPPEQFEGDINATGPVSDVYSLGVTLYELLSGSLPYSGTVMQIMAQALKGKPSPPSDLREGIDPKLERICLKMMATRADDRFQSMQEVGKALTEWLKSETAGTSTVMKPRQKERSTQAAESGGGTSIAVLTAGGGVVIGLLVMVVWLLFGGTSEPDSPDQNDTASVTVDVPPVETVQIDPISEATITTDAQPVESSGEARVVCESLAAGAEPAGLAPGVAHFNGPPLDERNGANGIQYTAPDWTAWTKNEWRFTWQSSGDATGVHVLNPIRTGQAVVLLERDKVTASFAWNGGSYTRFPRDVRGTRLPGFNDVFPLDERRQYEIVSRIDERGGLEVEIDGTPVLNAQFDPVRDFITDGAITGRSLPRAPQRARLSDEFKGDGFDRYWMWGSGGILVGPVDNGTNQVADIRFQVVPPRSPRPLTDEQLNQGLVAWLSFDDEGTPFRDDSGLNQAVQVVGNPERTDGLINGAVDLDGESELVLPNAGDFDWDQPFTVCAFVRPRKVSGEHGIFMRQEGDLTTAGAGYLIKYTGGAFVTVLRQSATLKLRQIGLTGAWTNDWRHLAFTYDGSGRRFGLITYEGGIQTMADALRGDRLTGSIRTSAPLVIGRAFDGLIDDVRIYNRVLTSEELTFLASPPATTRRWTSLARN